MYVSRRKIKEKMKRKRNIKITATTKATVSLHGTLCSERGSAFLFGEAVAEFSTSQLSCDLEEGWGQIRRKRW